MSYPKTSTDNTETQTLLGDNTVYGALREGLRKDIYTNLLFPTYYREIATALSDRDRYLKWGICFETLVKITVALTSIASLADNTFKGYNLSFVSGCLGVVSMFLLGLVSHFLQQSKERTEQINILLKTLGIEPVPDIVVEQPQQQHSDDKQ